MQAVEQVRSLYAYNAWANSQVLEATAALSEDERSSELGASFGSVQGNLWHLLSAQSIWLSRWTGSEFSPVPPPQGAGALDTLRHGFESSHAAIGGYMASLTDEALDGDVSYTDTLGAAQRLPLWQTLLQVANHGTHHRAEIALVMTGLVSRHASSTTSSSRSNARAARRD